MALWKCRGHTEFNDDKRGSWRWGHYHGRWNRRKHSKVRRMLEKKEITKYEYDTLK